MIICRSLESLLYAWRTQQKCVVYDPTYINRHEDKYKVLDYENLNSCNAYEYWANLCFCMSMTGLLLCPNNIESLREDDGQLTLATKRSKIVKLNLDKINVFREYTGQSGRIDILIETKNFVVVCSILSIFKDSYSVYDYFDVRSAKPHNISLINGDDHFVKKINFFPSPRIGANQTKDLVASSVMTREQLLSPDWGNGIVRLKVLRMMDSEGITGSLSVRTETKAYYKKPKINFYKRIVSDKITPLYSLKDIVEMKQIKGEPWKTIQILKTK